MPFTDCCVVCIPWKRNRKYRAKVKSSTVVGVTFDFIPGRPSSNLTCIWWWIGWIKREITWVYALIDWSTRNCNGRNAFFIQSRQNKLENNNKMHLLHHSQVESLWSIPLNRWFGHLIRWCTVHFDRVNCIARGNRHRLNPNIAMGKNPHHPLNAPTPRRMVAVKWPISMRHTPLDNAETKRNEN